MCSILLGNENSTEMRKALRYRSFKINELARVHLPENFCETLTFTSYPKSAVEESTPLAFVISMYKNIEQVLRVLRLIYRPWNWYCVHLDTSSPEEMQKILEMVASCLPNVLLPQKRFDVKWGGVTVLYAALSCVKTLLQPKHDWKYLL
jgi:hypothetical protein